MQAIVSGNLFILLHGEIINESLKFLGMIRNNLMLQLDGFKCLNF